MLPQHIVRSLLINKQAKAGIDDRQAKFSNFVLELPVGR